ncbi:amidohydrolase/deacetylase family metallohydrolase [Lactococcus formosensis]|jgi:dihydroorotase|uniref:amidohydrolase/deacetylase family metallohydrolase n=1 Tax=Lactococcus formosensis TaxID=1281486 RepID=UPI00254BA961|nr:amidohydrolase/deacetylase family metallohydrolase [Lactococcus formosensis]
MYDTLIKNAKTIHEETIEIGITNGKISKISEKITEKAREKIDVQGLYVSAGWIDAHVHCFEKMTLYYDYPDEVGINSGVTTIVDAGSTGENNIKDFYQLAQKAKTNVYALMNISKDGIIKQNELADLSKVNIEKNMERLQELPEFIIGLKARMSKTVIGENGVKPLLLAKELQRKVNLPLMVHIGTAPVDLEELFSYLETGDIVTHCFNGKDNGILDQTGNIKPFAKKAYKNGIHFDIGHGTDSFNFEVARRAKKENIIADSISTDIYLRNRKNGPVYSLAITMEKLLAIGYSLDEVLFRVTEAPADALKIKNKGQLKEDFDADLTFFELIISEKYLMDSNGNKEQSHQKIIPRMAFIKGEKFDI